MGFVRALAIPFCALLVASAHAQSSPQFQCGDASMPAGVQASDALIALRTAVLLEQCSPCACDADGSGEVTASDALLTLRKAVGHAIELRCPFCCALCECTPQEVVLVIDDAAPCEGCIPRTVASNTVNSITIEFDDVVNAEHTLPAVAECVWETRLPSGIVEKIFYGSGPPDCSGSPVAGGSADVVVRVERTETGWDVRAGQYAASLGWGDAAHASIEAATCELGGQADSENETCHLAAEGDPSDHDTHMTGGTTTISISDPEPICP